VPSLSRLFASGSRLTGITTDQRIAAILAGGHRGRPIRSMPVRWAGCGVPVAGPDANPTGRAAPWPATLMQA
jgi:hypothetical protein